MKIERSKVKRSSSDVPLDCKSLIVRLKSAGEESRPSFLRELQRIETWTYGKCELFHWVDVLDICDDILADAVAINKADGDNEWSLACDGHSEEAGRLRELLLWTLHFTTLLIEHSFSRHLYSSMEHLTRLLASSDLDVVLAVLNLLYMFSKRSNFLTRLSEEKRSGLLSRLTHLAASWGGRENGFGLAKCCADEPIQSFPDSATTLHFEFYSDSSDASSNSNNVNKLGSGNNASAVTVIHMAHVDRLSAPLSSIMDQLLKTHTVPEEKNMLLFTYLRLAAAFSDYPKRLKCVQARLQALSVLIYSNQMAENIQSLLYPGLLEELVELLEMKGDHLMEIKAAALKALTSIIHLDRNPNYPKLNTIIDVTGASSYHGFLPVLVRNCITSLTANVEFKMTSNTTAVKSSSTSTKTRQHAFPQPLATALFSFLYHLASYEAGGEALVSCGMLESLLKVIQWPSTELDHITFVTRAVRVIDLITNLDMQSFQSHSGLTCFINRLEMEVEFCRKEQPFEIAPGKRAVTADSNEEEAMDVDQHDLLLAERKDSASGTDANHQLLQAPLPGVTCLPQRAALLKSMLNFLKKAIQETAFADGIRHIMDGPFPRALKHIISNAEYYGPSLFLLATDVVTAYVFQEPSLLSSLQEKGLTDVVLHALLVKDVPATREVLGSLPNVFSALCLNSRGLQAFVACKPFERLFKVLLSPDYLPAMRRRRSSDPIGDTASNLGNAMDELMRHQPTLKTAATGAIIKLLEKLCNLGHDPKLVCSKSASSKGDTATNLDSQLATSNNETSNNEAAGSSDEDDDDVDEDQNSNQATTAIPSVQQDSESSNTTTSAREGNMNQVVRGDAILSGTTDVKNESSERESIPLVDYIHNVMKFIDAILSNNSTDDHCREFVLQGGLKPLTSVLGLPNLPIDFPTVPACQSVASVAKVILNLAHEPEVLRQGLICLNSILTDLEPLHQPLPAPGGSVLLHELASATVISEAIGSPEATPLLHKMAAAHAYIHMFVHVCRTGQNDIRTMTINHWGSELGISVLRALSKLYTSLVWESTILLALCSEDTLPPDCEFGKADMERLLPNNGQIEQEETFSPASGTSVDSNSSVTTAMENLSTDPESQQEIGMDVDTSSSTTATPVTNSSLVASTSQKQNSKSGHGGRGNPSLHYQIKQVKPLLSASSRLGRALAELFALLVKLCVGSPLRQRRGQHVPIVPTLPSAPARDVATALTQLLASGLSWEPPSTSPLPRFRLTFFICSVGFTTPMLFDDKKHPYHLMLMKFIASGAQKAFFDAFEWAIGQRDEDGTNNSSALPEGSGEFLDVWLLLLEKMVNTKAVLESTHTLPTTPLKDSCSFVFKPIKYLARTHRLAFEAVMKLWNRQMPKDYGSRISETMLAILCHILKGEKMIKEKLEEDQNKNEDCRNALLRGSQTSATNNLGSEQQERGEDTVPQTSSSSASAAIDAPSEAPASGVNAEHLRTLMDMGFARERCIQAIQSHSTLEQATDALLSNPLSSLADNDNETIVSDNTMTTTPRQPSSSGAGEHDDLMRAIALSLGESMTVSSGMNKASGTSKEAAAVHYEYTESDFEPLCKTRVDSFTNEAITSCLNLLDSLPYSVYRVRDLMLTIFARNGNDFKQSVIETLVEEVANSLQEVKLQLQDMSKDNYCSEFEAFSESCASSKASARLHLLTLLFEECKLTCAKVTSEHKLIDVMTDVLANTQTAMTKALDLASTKTTESSSDSADVNTTSMKLKTPIWMTPLLLFVDLNEKVVLGLNRRAQLAKVCSHNWRYFDTATGKWCSYNSSNNKAIDDAFWAGEQNVKITNGRRKYTIHFATMMQSNEETGNRRPVMNAIKESPKVPTDNKVEVSESKKDEATTLPECKTTTTEGLSEKHKVFLLQATVALIKVPISSECLNALMRLLLRLTQDFRLASLFANLGGIRTMLSLKQASNFTGFSSMVTLIVRHVMEDEATLRFTMEKVVRFSALNASTNLSKELHYLLRLLASAACRAPSIFSEVCIENLRVDHNLLTKRPGDMEEDQRLLVNPVTPKGQNQHPALQPMAKGVVADLLNVLLTPENEKTSLEKTATNLEKKNNKNQQRSVSGANRTQEIQPRFNSPNELSLPDTESAVPRLTSSSENNTTASSSNYDKNKETFNGDSFKESTILSKSAVCRILAELVKSYSGCAKLITEHVYEANGNNAGIIKEDTSALSFILDELLVNKNDSNIAPLVKTLMAAIASCNHHIEAQTMLVMEVKSALFRALAFNESSLKHHKIQALSVLISTMIESSGTSHQQIVSSFKQSQQQGVNNVAKVMLKKGLISDLARVSHSLDLSSPHLSTTVNAVLKPLEVLTRLVNLPSNNATRSMASESAKKLIEDEEGGDSGNNVDNNMSTSSATRAQREDSGEPEAEATEHDVSTTAESVDPISESHLQTVEEGNDDEDFDEMMDQLLERDNNNVTQETQQQIIADVIEEGFNDMLGNIEAREETQHDSQMLSQGASQFENQQLSQDEDEHISDSSHSQSEEAAEERDEPMEEANQPITNNDVHEEDDEDDDDEEDEEDDEEDDDHEDEGMSPFEDEEHDEDVEDELQNFQDAIISRYPNASNAMDTERDDMDVIFHYPPHASDTESESHQHYLSDVLSDRSRTIHLPLWSDVSNDTSENSDLMNHVAPSHPMLVGRDAIAADGSSSAPTGVSSTGRPGSLQAEVAAALGRRSRSNGGFRGYIHLNSRGHNRTSNLNPSAPASVLQNFLGPSSAHGILHSIRQGTPFFIDFGYALLDSLESELNESSESRNTGLTSIPSALIRWNEESRVVDGDSIHDCVTALKPDIVAVIERVRDEQMAEKRAQRKKRQEEEEANRRQKSDNGPQDIMSTTQTGGEEQSEMSEDRIVDGENEEQRADDQLHQRSTATAEQQHQRPIPEQGEDEVMTNAAARIRDVFAAAISSITENADDDAGIEATSSAPTTTTTTLVVSTTTASSTTGTTATSTVINNSSGSDDTLSNVTTSGALPVALAPLSPSPIDTEGLLNSRDVNMDDNGGDDDEEDEEEDEDEEDEAMHVENGVTPPDAAPRNFENSANGGQEPTAQSREGASSGGNNDAGSGPSGENVSGTTVDYSAILGMDVSELPEGVDPSFLAALPEEMRQEVIDEQRLFQSILRRAQQPQQQSEQPQQQQQHVQEVSPDFLAALPPNLQEEVLAQQRHERQRQAALNSNPEAPVDPGEFLQTLPTSLRQSVLADMEESQMAALPAHFAEEARTLRRQYVRSQRLLGHSNGASMPSILRGTMNRFGGHGHSLYISNLDGGSRRRANMGYLRAANLDHRLGAASGPFGSSSVGVRVRGKQLLDQEGLSCLLVLLFIDDSKINTSRLHRIVRNLCYHSGSREWVVSSLLSILDKANESTSSQKKQIMVEHSHGTAVGNETPPAKIRKSTTTFSVASKDYYEGSKSHSGSHNNTHNNVNNAWLNVSMDAALGFRANVFQVTRAGGGKRSVVSDRSSNISIHSGAANFVCLHTLELLIYLAKNFPAHFLPFREESSSTTKSTKSDPSSTKGKTGTTHDFWDTLLKLDHQSSSKKGKGITRSHSGLSSALKSDDTDSDQNTVIAFQVSAFGVLLGMLSSSVIRRSSVITDKLLRLLSQISGACTHYMQQRETSTEDGQMSNKSPSEKSNDNKELPSSLSIPSDLLKLAVDVLTSKTCSEEGLEDVNTLILNLAQGPSDTRETILNLLLKGAQELGAVVRKHILSLQSELKDMRLRGELTTIEENETKVPSKGNLVDRFTSSQVVLSAPTKVKSASVSELQLPAMLTLTNKTSSQAFFLRVLKVIIQLRDAELKAIKKDQKKEQQAANETTASKDDVNNDEEAIKGASKRPTRLELLSTQLSLDPLWSALSDCLTDLANTSDQHAVLVLQATVEAFFLVHSAPTEPDNHDKLNKVAVKESMKEQLAHIEEAPLPAKLLKKMDSKDDDDHGESTTAMEDEEEQCKSIKETDVHKSTSAPTTSTYLDTQHFVSFAETHRTVLNHILRQCTTHLSDGPFSVLVEHTRVLDFDVKRRYFRTELERLDEGVRKEDLAIHVKRENVFEDSFRELHRKSSEEWKNRFYIVFENEEGQDAGGLLREWYVIISREIFNPMYALFKTSPGDKVTYMIYEQSQTNPNHLDYFKFVGRVIAKAIYDNKLLECYFTRSFYKHILAKKVKYTDMESEDYAFYKGLDFLSQHSVNDLGYELTFSTEIREFGVTETRDLIPDGRNVRVTDDNKLDYIALVCQMKMTGAIRKQLQAFLEGFYDIIPRKLISIFNEQELELLLSGLPTIDVDDLKNNTEYYKYQANSLQIVWFWRALRSFDQTDKAKFLQFVTGSSKVPLQGFGTLEGMNGAQKFQIHKDERSTDRLPSAHTCFNQLDLPAYETYDKLRSHLLKAIHECSEGFGFA